MAPKLTIKSITIYVRRNDCLIDYIDNNFVRIMCEVQIITDRESLFTSLANSTLTIDFIVLVLFILFGC